MTTYSLVRETSYRKDVVVSRTHSDMLCLWIPTVCLLKTDSFANWSVINNASKLPSVPQRTCILSSMYFFKYFCAFHIIKFHDCFYFVSVDIRVNIYLWFLFLITFRLPAGNIGYNRQHFCDIAAPNSQIKCVHYIVTEGWRK